MTGVRMGTHVVVTAPKWRRPDAGDRLMWIEEQTVPARSGRAGHMADLSGLVHQNGMMARRAGDSRP
ncbi:hypothetical protein CFR80_09860 [Komagataeibacter oboediens]|uniref:Uncharacterized protein n=1 Tax=Komagataeibacter oboediens TaxID=65958 RepID=A0A318R1V4_9PROT|nr:hypothetical protein CFR80_09860 [Komagataeibacter oboediens]